MFHGADAESRSPPEAVNFTREFYKQNHGELAIMTGFAKITKVDMAWVVYPLHQPSNYGLFLVADGPIFPAAAAGFNLAVAPCGRAKNGVRTAKIKIRKANEVLKTIPSWVGSALFVASSAAVILRRRGYQQL